MAVDGNTPVGRGDVGLRTFQQDHRPRPPRRRVCCRRAICEVDIGKQPGKFAGMRCHDVMCAQKFEKPRRIARERGDRIGIQHNRYIALQQRADNIRDARPCPRPNGERRHAMVDTGQLIVRLTQHDRGHMRGLFHKRRAIADNRHQPRPDRQSCARRQPRCASSKRRPAPDHRMAPAIFMRIGRRRHQRWPGDRAVLGEVKRKSHSPSCRFYLCSVKDF